MTQPEQPGSGEEDLFSELFEPPRGPEEKPIAPSQTPAAPQPTPTVSKPLRVDSELPRTPVRTASPPRRISSGHQTIPAPRSPKTLEEAGLSQGFISDMILRHVSLQSHLSGQMIASRMRIPFHLIDESLLHLKTERLLEVASGDRIGTASYRFTLTDRGRRRADEAFEQCRYVGPAPVTLEAYTEQALKQRVSDIGCTPPTLARAFNDLIIRPFLLEELGPAVCSGSSIFLYGPPGNGKTQIAKGLGRFLNTFGGHIHVPYAIQTEGAIVTIYDPTLHEIVPAQSSSDTGEELDVDLRWTTIKRPVIITGGELNLEMLDLRYNSVSNFYTAPVHVKANGGVFLIDDFGRQLVSPKDLLNRWIFPLEESVDYLSLVTGKKFPVPFEQLIIFSTNLDPGDLVDAAFLRRIKHKIQIGPPSRDLYTDIFQLVCQHRGIPFHPMAVEFLYEHFYDRGKEPRASDPRDLLEIADSICRFREETVQLSPDLMAEATRRFFCNLGAPA